MAFSCLVAASALIGLPQAAALDGFIAESLKRYNVPGAAVAVVQDGKVVLVKGYGVREMGTNNAVDENTRFLLASVTKSMTGVLAGMMVDQGKLEFDRPIHNYLPQFVHYDPYVQRHLTMRDLLAQRTGWPAFSGDILGQVGFSRAEVLRRLRYFEPRYSLREVATYSNPGFFVAGEVISAVGGASWDDLMKRQLFGPLQMTRSDTTHASLLTDNTTKYHMVMDGKASVIPAFNHDVLGPAGSAASTAADMAKYLLMLTSGGQYNGRQLLKKETLEDIFARSMVSEVSFAEMAPISENTGFYYGLGFGSYDYAGTRVMEKGGGLPGIRTVIVLVPEKRAGIAVMSNMNMTSFPEAIRARWLAQVLGTSDVEDQKKIFAAGQAVQKMFATPQRPSNPGPAPYKAADLVGVYEHPLYGQFRIEQRGSGLVVLTGKITGKLDHVQGGMYWLDWDAPAEMPMDMTFMIGADGKAVAFDNEIYGTFKRVR